MTDQTAGQQLLEAWFQRLAPTRSPAAMPNAPAETPAEPVDAGDVVERVPPAASPESFQAENAPRTTLLDSISRRAMACEFEVLLNRGQYALGVERAVEALELIEQLEQLLSVYKSRSELSVVNRFAHLRPIPLSTDTFRLLELAMDLHGLTQGAFDITAGSLSEAWGFSRHGGRLPSQAEVDEALRHVGSHMIRLDPTQRTASMTEAGVKLNPGGIGKGYALDRAAAKLEQAGLHDFILHGGLSSIVARGNRWQDGVEGWSVALKHPWRVEEQLGTLRLFDQALATSGSGKQFFHIGGRRYSHIIDPRSGWPAQGMLSATVICPSGAVADALATAMFVMGNDAAQQFCSEQPAIGAVLIYSDAKSGRPRLATCNLSPEQWQPISAPHMIIP